MKTLTIITLLLISSVSFGQITLPKKIVKKEVKTVPKVKDKVKTPKTNPAPATNGTERKRPGRVKGKTTKPVETPVNKPKKKVGKL